MGPVHRGIETSPAYHILHRWKSRVRAFPFSHTNSNDGGVRIAQALNDDIKRTHVPLLSDVVPPPRRSIRLARQIRSKTTLALVSDFGQLQIDC
jgi:hypothetical protein